MHELLAIRDLHQRIRFFLSFSALLAKAPVPAGSNLWDNCSHHDGFEHPVEALAI
jgi:hypothetical protein